MVASPERPVTDRMQSLIEQWEAAADARALFLRCYRMMTANVLTATAAGEFFDPEWVNRLLHRFAEYYFEALEAYNGQLDSTPAVWQVAFEEAGTAKRQALQILLLGVNAHINYDLVLTLVDMLGPEWDSLAAEQRAQRYADHCHINDIIGRTIDAVQDEVVEPASTGMGLVDTTFGPLDEWLTSRLISHWREEVWQNALLWLDTRNVAQKEALRRQIEEMTLKRADAILLEGGILVFRHLF